MQASSATDTTAFDAFDETLRGAGPAAALEQLTRTLAERGEFRALLDALLLKARHELGLPAIQPGRLEDLPEPVRSRYEERYVEAIRTVGSRLLEAGDLPAAWPYFRAIGEPGPIVAALEAYRPDEADERLGQVVEVAFNQGAHPRRGFELILDHYGACSAITAFEHLPPDEPTRRACADRLVRHLHGELTASLRADIARRGQPVPPEGTSIPGLLAGRPWLFVDDAYHLDVSHLSSVVRMAPLLTDPAALALAVELTDYGRNLSPRHRYEGDPPSSGSTRTTASTSAPCSARTSRRPSPTSTPSSPRPIPTAGTRPCRPRSSSASWSASAASMRPSTWRPPTWPVIPTRR